MNQCGLCLKKFILLPDQWIVAYTKRRRFSLESIIFCVSECQVLSMLGKKKNSSIVHFKCRQ